MNVEKNRLLLIRTNDDKSRTLGQYLVVDELGVVQYTCPCLELPWKGNKRDISCILADTYILTKTKGSPSFNYAHFDIRNVKGRSYIKIHALNYISQSRGCQGAGLSVSEDGQAVWNSRKALNKLLWHLPEKTTITIIDAFK